MSAEKLREAAALMRERAEAATAEDEVGSRWVAKPMMKPENQGWRIDFTPEADGFDSTLAQTPYDYEGSLATHLSGWHPAVVLAVARWLDSAADHMDPELALDGGCPDCEQDGALAVARAYLGSDQ